jgi:diguanylate cyclase (GGDEF)-like protein
MRILIADDSNVSRHLLESIVKKWGYQVLSTCDGNQAWEVLQQKDAPRLAILDWMMPGLTGPEVCRLVRNQGIEPYTYILLLTSRTQKADVIEGMTAGADDYVLKPFDQQELNVRLRAGRRVIELQDELLRAQAALKYQATHDVLTGVENRGRIREQLDTLLQEPGPAGIILLDLDRFKLVNDSYGHAAGDAVLVATAQRLTTVLGPLDSVGRYGGEEFLVVSRRAKQDLLPFAEQLRFALASEPVRTPSLALNVTASFGVSHRGAIECTADQMLHAADLALYVAKDAGRNSIHYLDPNVEGD